MVKKTMKRPGGITWACILIWLGAIVSILSAVYVAMVGTSLPIISSGFGVASATETVSSMLVSASIMSIIIAVLWMFIGYALWNKNTIAWYLAIIFTAIGFISVLLPLFTFAISLVWFINIAITIFTLICLVDKKSVRYCKVKWKGVDTGLF